MKIKSGFLPPHWLDAVYPVSFLISTSARSSVDQDEDVSVYQKLLGEPDSQVVLEERRRSRGTRARWIMGLVQFARRRPIIFISTVFAFVAIIVLVVPLAVVYGRHSHQSLTSSGSWAEGTWDAENFKSLVTFGDSYTDESRGLYFQSHGGQAPPPGWTGPITTQTAVGGYVWGRWLSWYSGATLYNYAVGGAVCSTGVTPTGPTTIGIEQYEVGAHEADLNARSGGKPVVNIQQDETVYAIWIGTNDLGRHGFIDDMQAPKNTLNDYVECIFNQFDRLYKLGARRFVLMNNIPLNLVGMYATLDKGGYPAGKDQFWPDKPSNVTAISARMKDLVTSSNSAFRNRTSYEFGVAKRYPGAEGALFDTHQLFTDIYNNPSQFLNGTVPANVTTSCLTFPVLNQPGLRCTSPDSYIWYDELHPSEQASRIVAREFLTVLSGKSKYSTYWH